MRALFNKTWAERKGWDPMLFLIRGNDGKDCWLWTYYWTKARNGRWWNGQYPPLLDIDKTWEALRELRKLE